MTTGIQTRHAGPSPEPYETRPGADALDSLVRLLPPDLASHPRAADLAAGLAKLAADNPMTLEWFGHVARALSPVAAARFVDSFVKGTVLESWPLRKRFYEQNGFGAPFTVVLNPTMRCNLRCTGCYSYRFGRADMEYFLLARILREVHEMGTRFITISGGEPLMYPHLFRMAEDFPDMSFLMYTNGTLVDGATAERIEAAGNIFPAISVEGFEDETDARRGPGMFDVVLGAMEELRRRGVFFGFSATPTRSNSDTLCDDAFIDYWIGKGALFGWFFTYIPVGKDPDMGLMATPQQRDALRRKTRAWARTKPIFVGDFWNDGACSGGCLSASRYCYITVDGWVQPCTFVQFASQNIKDHSFVEVWRSPFFDKIRSMQPYCENLLRPCKIIDNPDFLKAAIEETGATPTCEGAGDILSSTVVREFLDRYSKEWAVLADEAWRSDDYKSGTDVLIPFLGRRNVFSHFPHLRDAAARRRSPA